MAENDEPPSGSEPPAPPPAESKPRKKRRKSRRTAAERQAREERVRAWLESRLAVAGMTRADVDRKLGEKVGTTSRLLRGTLKLTKGRRRKVLRAMGVPEHKLDEAEAAVRAEQNLKYPPLLGYRPRNKGVSPAPPPEDSLPTPVEELGEVLRMIEELHQVVEERIAALDRPPEPPPKRKSAPRKKSGAGSARKKRRTPAEPG